MKKNVKKYKRYVLYIFICLVVNICMNMSIRNDKFVKLIYWGLSESEIEQDCPMELEYLDHEGISRSVVIDNWSPRNVNGHYYEVYYRFPSEVASIIDMKVSLVKQEDTSSVKSLELYQNKLQVLKLAPSEMMTLFKSNAEAEINMPYVDYYEAEEQVWISAEEEMIDRFNNACNHSVQAYWNILFYSIVLLLVLFGIELNRKKIYHVIQIIKNSVLNYTTREKIMLALLVLIFASTAIVSFASDFCIHSDEYVYRMSIDYYLGGWRPPVSGESWLAGTFSPYGSSRLTEYTWYYFFAGKLGWFCYQFLNINVYYRMLNLICFAGILVTCWNKRDKYPWLYIAVCITPQLWYLFSYSTSDAWDYLWSLVVIYLLLEEHSPLNKLIDRSNKLWKNVSYILISGLIFSMIFLGKTNYYVVLLLAFIDLLIKWIKTEKKKKGILLIDYILILSICFGFYQLKAEMPKCDKHAEITYTGQTAEDFVLEDIGNGTTENSTTGLRMRDKGYTLLQVMRGGHASFFRALYTSSVGVYGINAFWSSGIYVCCMALLYIYLYGKAWKKKQKKWDDIIKLMILPVLFILYTAIVLYYCWTVDYQPTGRYILPLFLIFAYSAAVNKEMWKGKDVITAQYACTILGILSYWLVGIRNLVF